MDNISIASTAQFLISAAVVFKS